ncbi:MAG: hypothetical protein JEY91_16885 [Spirochaetaceae bacterium]|nr:hypothetical protein [Spirochaetaceae bacterium]
MEDFLTFSGPVKLLIVEQALIEGKSKSPKEGQRKILTRLIFNENQQISSELKESSTVEYEYNKNNQLVLITEKEKTGSLIEQTRFDYEGTLLIKKEKISSDDSLRECREYKYNSNEQLILEKCGSRHIKYEYKNNRIEKEYRYFGKEPELALIYSYDNHGNIIEIKTVNSTGSLIRLEKFTWQEGLLTGQFCLNENRVILKDDIYEYSCFHDGNWLKRIRYTLKNVNRRDPVDVIYRSIAYSDHFPEVRPVHTSNSEILKEEKQALSFSDGSSYRGDLTDGKMNGRGFIQWPDGSSYKGEFKEGKMDGKGILTWANGDIFSGTFVRGKMEGVGRLRWKQGKTFYGLFEDNRRTNQGIIEED